jgi:transcriptional regulator with XRE-family HTH domain
MKTQHDILMEDPEFRKLLAIEGLVAEASETIAGLMDQRGVSKADLARSLGKSRAWVTQLLSGKANMTVRTLAEVVHALGAEVKLLAQAPAWKAAIKTQKRRVAARGVQDGQVSGRRNQVPTGQRYNASDR